MTATVIRFPLERLGIVSLTREIMDVENYPTLRQIWLDASRKYLAGQMTVEVYTALGDAISRQVIRINNRARRG